MSHPNWVAPPIWSVPREWLGERCFVLCGGESLRNQRHIVPKLAGRFVAVKHGVFVKPDADVVFFAGERPTEIAPPCLKAFTGTHAVVRGRGHEVFPSSVKRVGRPIDHDRWCLTPNEVAGFDAGTSAINLAMHFGAKEIVLLGYDMQGGRWFNGEIPHYLPQPPETDFLRHLAPLPSLAAHAVELGINIWNASPISRAPFPFKPLEAFL
jgi:hypothetical protein